MLDYTDIPDKIEDTQNALDSLYNLIHGQYDGIFQGENAEKYQKMLQNIKDACKCIDELNDLNAKLSDVFEENLDKL